MRFFPGAISLLKGATFIDFLFLKIFLRIFNFLFLWLCIKESNYLLFKRGLRLFKGLGLLFLPNVPGAMFIQRGTFIPDSRVYLATLFQRSYSRFHEFTNSAKGSQSDKDRNDKWEKKPYSVNAATNGPENTFSIISIVEFNARFITYY